MRASWRGPARSKSETLGRYTFALCFENMVLKGWITEKIFDCFYSGTVPIYLGAPDLSAIGAEGRGVEGFQAYVSNPRDFGNNVMPVYGEQFSDEQLHAIAVFLDASKGPQD